MIDVDPDEVDALSARAAELAATVGQIGQVTGTPAATAVGTAALADAIGSFRDDGRQVSTLVAEQLGGAADHLAAVATGFRTTDAAMAVVGDVLEIFGFGD